MRLQMLLSLVPTLLSLFTGSCIVSSKSMPHHLLARRRRMALPRVIRHSLVADDEQLTLVTHQNDTAIRSWYHSATDKQSSNIKSTLAKNTEDAIKFDVPWHIAFICDGNSRWAETKSLPKSIGHATGAERVVNLISLLRQQKSQTKVSGINATLVEPQRIQYCTLFAFSTENWSRPTSEITALFKLVEKMAIQYQKHDAIKNSQVQIEVLGDLNDSRIPVGMRKELEKLQYNSRAACNKKRAGGMKYDDKLMVCLAINYGGRADIIQAAMKLAQSIAMGDLPPDGIINESKIFKRLSTANLPDPDLIIHKRGEKRLSNFLLWDAAYAELYFSDGKIPNECGCGHY
jgi:undecaprenyl diphosphate synthase